MIFVRPMRNIGAIPCPMMTKRKCPTQSSVLVRYVTLCDVTGQGLKQRPQTLALVLRDSTSATNLNVLMGKGLLGLSEEMLPATTTLGNTSFLFAKVYCRFYKRGA